MTMPSADCLSDNDVQVLLGGAGDETERARLRTHLDRCDECREWLAALVRSSPAPELATSSAHDTHTHLPPGTAVGRYRVLGVLGQGGMGVVYAALDPGLDREVALKLILPGLSARDPGMERRLVRESQAMARLSHPNVLAVHDIGRFAGQVYVAMALARGPTLRQWLRTPRPWRAVLEVFVQAGRGLAAAHAAGFVHRDFKPDNVLMDTQGHVLVSDFGLATLAPEAQPATDSTLPRVREAELAMTLTGTGTVVGTLAYMAPEQRRGEVADARSDLFSFCVALYEGLYGTRPFTGATVAELASAMDSGKLSASPRSAAVPAWLRRVVLRGLDPRPERRHEAMPALLAALTPRPRAMILGAGVGLLVVAGIVGLVVDGPRREPECGADTAALADLWSPRRRAAAREVFLAPETEQARFVWHRIETGLDRQLADLTGMYTEVCAATRRGEQSQALLDTRIHCLEIRRSELAAAIDGLARDPDVDHALQSIDGLHPVEACARAEVLERRVPVPADPSTAAEANLLRIALAELDTHHHAGRRAESYALATALLRRASALAWRPIEAEVLLRVGRLEAESRDPHLGAEQVRRAAHLAEASHHDLVSAEAWSFLAFHAAQGLGDRSRAHEYADMAAAAIERLGGEPELAAKLEHYRGLIALGEEDMAAARNHFERAAGQMQAAGMQQQDLVFEGLALIADAEGRYNDALALAQRGLELRRERHGPDHPTVAISHTNIANILNGLGRPAEAEPHLRRVAAIYDSAYGPDHVDQGRLHCSLGELLNRLGRIEEGLAHNDRALEILRAVHGPEHQEVAIVLEHRALLYMARERDEEAVALLREALAMYRRQLEPGHPFFGRCELNLGEALRRTGQLDEAREHERSGMANFAAHLPPRHVYLGYARTSVARTLLASGRPEEARPLLEQALAEYPAEDVDPRQVAITRAALGLALWNTDRPRARALLDTARAALVAAGPGLSRELAELDR